MTALFDRLQIDRKLVITSKNAAGTAITYTLDTPARDTSTLDLIHRPEYWITESRVWLNGLESRRYARRTVAEKEILIALMQHGRTTVFNDQACDVRVLQEHIRLRQHIVAYAENLEFQWPDGGKAKWNAAYWNQRRPKQPAQLYAGLRDMFTRSQRYSIGCYLAAKATYTFAILDFYHRQPHHAQETNHIFQRLAAGDSPFEGIEPSAMWRFEPDHDFTRPDQVGKLMKLQHKVAAKNFVPGDWAYFYNTDPSSHQKIGYEGSNTIYLGRGLFVDFYNDAEHKYTYEQKLSEVFQWRHGVFSQSRDYRKTELLSPRQFDRLSGSPEHGGMVPDIRAVPYYFGYESIPPLDAGRGASSTRWMNVRRPGSPGPEAGKMLTHRSPGSAEKLSSMRMAGSDLESELPRP